MTTLARFFTAFALVLGLVSLTSTGLAQEDREAARTEFERGRSAFEAGAFREALDHFQEAYRLAPHPNVRVNIANCYDQLDRPIEALVHFEHFLAEAQRPPAAQRREVESAIARLRQRVGAITLQVTPDGAVITIDGNETRRAPVAEPVRVVAGSHTVEVRLEGYRTERQTVSVEGGGTARVALRLTREEPGVASAGTTGAGTTGAATGAGTTGTTSGTGTVTATAGTTGGGTVTATAGGSTGGGSTGVGSTGVGSTGGAGTTTRPTDDAVAGRDTTPDERPSEGGGVRVTPPVIVAGAVTVAALVGSAIFGGLALAANGSFEDAVGRANDTSLSGAEREQARIDGEGAASDARTFALVTDVMLITAAVGAGVTTALFIIAQGEGEGEDSVAFVPVVAPGTAGLLATGRF